MNTLIETSIELPDFGRGPHYMNIFNVNNFKKKVNYSDIAELSGKKVMVLFSCKEVTDGTIKDFAVELFLPILQDEFSMKMYIINKLKTIVNNVN
jgi:hypothetical protein